LKKALLVVFLDTHFTELRRVAHCLQNSGRYTPEFFFARSYPALIRDMVVCLEAGYPCYDPYGKPCKVRPQQDELAGGVDAEVSVSLPRRIWRWLYPWLSNSLPWAWREYHQLYAKVSRFLQEQQIDLLILAEENVGYATPIWTQAACAANVPVVIVPYTVADASEPAGAVKDIQVYQFNRWPNQIAGSLYPQWVYEHEGRKLLRLPAGQAIAMQMMGAAPPQPWIMNSSSADAIAVESDRMRRHYQRLGLPEGQLVETGALYDDVLAEGLQSADERREALYRELGLPAGRPLLLCALPPNPYPDQLGGFASYEDLLRFWVATLAAQRGWNLVLRLHPRMPRAQFAFLEEIGGRITEEDTAHLVPLCDLYVASVSATIRWAIACGKPVVNYDVYRLNYDDYKGLLGVITVSEKQAFVDIIQTLTDDPERLAAATAAQEAVREQWGCLDGQSRVRLLKLLDGLTG
jgi:hypothetical protein